MPKNFNILNAAGDTATINIDGAIGESWFGDSISKEDIRNELQEIKASTIVVNISSLGGSMNHAFAIHDMLKMHDATVKVKIIGATASSGTIIAMAGDEVDISENALFLVHNGWTMTVGNANDHREMAEELDKWDGVAVGIYARKTGKSRSEILALMEEEKWINADEAKEWGFVDNVFEPVAIAASVIKEIKGSKLPKLPQNKFDMPINEKEIENNIFEKVKAWFKNEQGDKSEEAIKAQANEIAAEIKAEYDEKITNLEAEKAELETINSNIEAKMNEQIEAKETDIANLQAKISKLEGKPADPKPEKDPSASVEEEKLDPVAAIGAKFREQIYASNK